MGAVASSSQNKSYQLIASEDSTMDVVTSSNNEDDEDLPKATFICFDFRSYERMGWDVTTTGIASPIPYALAAVNVDTPVGFPEIPEQWVDAEVKNSAIGLYEVANVLERYLSRLDPNHPVRVPYQDTIRRMERGLYALYDDYIRDRQTCNIDETRRMSIIRICEDTNYDLEAIIGLIQLFEDISCTYLLEHGVERIGVLLTFNHYSYEQNYNLNFIMACWLRKNWVAPYDDYNNQVNCLSHVYGLNPIAVQSWIHNAISIVWTPMLTPSQSLASYLETRSLKLDTSKTETEMNTRGSEIEAQALSNSIVDFMQEVEVTT